MRRTHWLLPVLAGVLAAGASRAALPPERMLAPDTLAFLAVPSWKAAAAAWRSNALGQLWADPALRPFREKFQARFKTEVIRPLEQQLGLELGVLDGLIQGQVTLALTATPPDGLPAKSTGFLFLADAAGATHALSTNLAAWRRKWAESGRQVKTLAIRQVEFSVLSLSLNEITAALDRVLPELEAGDARDPATPRKPVTVDWTIGQAGTLLVVSDSAREVDRLLAMLGTNPPPSLADGKLFAADASLLEMRDSLLYAWLNGKTVLEHLAPALPGGPAATADGAAPLSFGQIAQTLGLAGLQSAALALRESPDGTRVSLHLRVPETMRAGLFRLAALEPKESGPPPFVPDDVVKFSRLRLDLPRGWNSFEALLAEVSPPAASFLRFIIATAGKDKDEKFDLRQQLVARLGDDLMSWDKLPPQVPPRSGAAPAATILLGARNPDQLFEVIPALTGLLPPEITKSKESEVLGRKVRSVTLPRTQADGTLAPGPAWNYAATGGYLALSGDSALLQEHLRHVESAPHPLRDRPGFAAAAQRVGGLNTGCFSYENTGESARLFFEAAGRESFNAASLLGLLKLGNTLGLGRGGGILSWCDFGLLPPYERVSSYFHLNVATLSLGPQGFTYRYFAPTPPALR